MHIGKFVLSKEGGWVGTVRTLTFHAKLRVLPNDDNTSNRSPAFKVFVGNFRIGDAWETKTSDENPRTFYRQHLDDPNLREPLSAALFPSDTGDTAQLVWNSRREAL